MKVRVTDSSHLAVFTHFNAMSVPVYDARTPPHGFTFTTDVKNIETALPRWTEGEIPVGSCVATAYSVVMYMSGKKKWTLACNIRWAMVLGVKDHTVKDN
jgi:hypothetical protein